MRLRRLVIALLWTIAGCADPPQVTPARTGPSAHRPEPLPSNAPAPPQQPAQAAEAPRSIDALQADLRSTIPVTPVIASEQQWEGCVAGTTAVGALEVRCAELEPYRFGPLRLSCAELRRTELTPAPGDELVFACRGHCDSDSMTALVVASAASPSPIVAIGTTSDSACLVPTFRGRRIVLEGFGEDVSFRTTFAWRNNAMARVASHVARGAHRP